MDSLRRLLPLAALLIAAPLLTGCAGANNPADPLEPFNRGVYRFNDTVDKAAIKPVAQAYKAVIPEPGRMLVSNFISNLDDILVTANDLLQLKFAQAASDGSRFLINSTFGLGGLLNVASRLEKHHEDFGQTLGYWGVGDGPYLVLPFLGPSSMRDAPGLYVDTVTGAPGHIENIPARNQYYLGEFVHRRAALLDSEKVLDEAAIDRYDMMRDAYLMRRKNLVYDGNPPRERYYDE
ncbi:MAG: VacJ family lipoprotein [Nitrosomonadales bacterium]|nr:VacJ family lipoprotein [Nitrosomonadales bacterium]